MHRSQGCCTHMDGLISWRSLPESPGWRQPHGEDGTVYWDPQGSVLGPPFVIVYILPWWPSLTGTASDTLSYADRSQLYDRIQLRYSRHIKDSVVNMKKCLTDVQQWMACNKLKLNDTKICAHSDQAKPKEHVESTPVKADESSNILAKCVKNLGGYFDNAMLMETQVCAVVQSAKFHIRQISKINHLLDGDTSCLDYHKELLCGVQNKHIRSLHIVRSNAAHLQSDKSSSQHMTLISKHNHWLQAPSKWWILYI